VINIYVKKEERGRWRTDSSIRAPAYQVSGPEFKHQCCQKKKKKKKSQINSSPLGLKKEQAKA
jgi:hypothetical protein